LKPLEEIIRSLGYVDAQGNLNIAEFARFLGKKYSTVHKYVKNERNIGGGFIFDLKAKIPALNIEYFSKENEPMFIEEVRTLPSGIISQPEPLSGGG